MKFKMLQIHLSILSHNPTTIWEKFIRLISCNHSFHCRSHFQLQNVSFLWKHWQPKWSRWSCNWTDQWADQWCYQWRNKWRERRQWNQWRQVYDEMRILVLRFLFWGFVHIAWVLGIHRWLLTAHPGYTALETKQVPVQPNARNPYQTVQDFLSNVSNFKIIESTLREGEQVRCDLSF